jgi:hypothetical protein
MYYGALTAHGMAHVCALVSTWLHAAAYAALSAAARLAEVSLTDLGASAAKASCTARAHA